MRSESIEVECRFSDEMCDVEALLTASLRLYVRRALASGVVEVVS